MLLLKCSPVEATVTLTSNGYEGLVELSIDRGNLPDEVEAGLSADLAKLGEEPVEVTLTIVVPRSRENLIGEYELRVVAEGGDYRDEERFTLEITPENGPVETSLTMDRPPDVVEKGDTLTFTGRLTVEKNGSRIGVAGKEVEIYDEDPDGLLGSPDDPMASGRTDEDGYFSIEWEAELMDDLWPWEGPNRSVEAYARFEGGDDFLGSKSSQWDFKVRERRWTVKGYVKDVQGHPLGGVQLDVGGDRKHTGEDGFYRKIVDENSFKIEATLKYRVGKESVFLIENGLDGPPPYPGVKREVEVPLRGDSDSRTENIVFEDAGVIYYYVGEAAEFYEGLGASLTLERPLKVEAFSHQSLGTYYDFGMNNKIYIHISDCGIHDPDKPKNREWHEFSHYAMEDSFGDGNMPPRHGNKDSNHGGYSNHCTSDSWAEGFAVFMPCVMAAEKGRPDADSYPLGHHSIELETNPLKDNTKNFRNWIGNWNENYSEEIAVASILWDLYDGPNTKDGRPQGDDDGVNLSRQTMWDLMMKEHKFKFKYKNGDWKEKEDERHVHYVWDLYRVFKEYAGNNSGLDVRDVDQIFEERGFPEGYSEYYENVSKRRA